MGDKVFNTSSGILGGFRKHFQTLATPSDDQSFDKNYSDLVEIEVREIEELCTRHPTNNRQIIPEQVKKANSSLNKGKTADIYGVAAEHFLHGGEKLFRTTANIISSLYRAGALTDCLKIGV